MTQQTRLLLIRHAQVDQAAGERLYGRVDPGLSVRGHRRARLIARTFERIPLEAVYSSPSTRARETATPLAAIHGLEPITDDKLLEIDFGEVEGQRFDEIAMGRPELYRSWMENPTHVRFPGGESYADLRARTLSAIHDIRKGQPGRIIAVVSHGGVLRAILADCLQMAEDATFRLDHSHGGFSVVDWFGDTPVVRVMNAQPTMVASRRRGFLPGLAFDETRAEL